jgi:hypothetical protein
MKFSFCQRRFLSHHSEKKTQFASHPSLQEGCFAATYATQRQSSLVLNHDGTGQEKIVLPEWPVILLGQKGLYLHFYQGHT